MGDVSVRTTVVASTVVANMVVVANMAVDMVSDSMAHGVAAIRAQGTGIARRVSISSSQETRRAGVVAHHIQGPVAPL